MKVNFKIVSCGCGCGYETLAKDGVLVLAGDDYHNKIPYMIEGYLQAFEDLGYNVNVEEEVVNNDLDSDLDKVCIAHTR